MTITILRKLIAWLTLKLRNAYLEKYYHDRMCPNCKRWGAELDGWENYNEALDGTERLECKGCGHVSHWVVHGPIATLKPAVCGFTNDELNERAEG